MGFYLWFDGDVAWAQGTYEYRPMGTAAIAVSDLFQRRDFRGRRRVPAGAEFVGQFASLGHLNWELEKRRGGGDARGRGGGPFDAEAQRR
jgi:hypothetical protein